MEKKNDEVTAYFMKFGFEKAARLESIRALIHEIVPEIQEKLWTGVPYFFTKKASIIIRVFGDHINFNARDVVKYCNELSAYKITPKGMLQIYDNQEIPRDALRKIIYSSMNNDCDS